MPIADDTKNVVKVRVQVLPAEERGAGDVPEAEDERDRHVYNREFKFNPATDQPWDIEKTMNHARIVPGRLASGPSNFASSVISVRCGELTGYVPTSVGVTHFAAV